MCRQTSEIFRRSNLIVGKLLKISQGSRWPTWSLWKFHEDFSERWQCKFKWRLLNANIIQKQFKFKLSYPLPLIQKSRTFMKHVLYFDFLVQIKRTWDKMHPFGFWTNFFQQREKLKPLKNWKKPTKPSSQTTGKEPLPDIQIGTGSFRCTQTRKS